MPKQNRPLVRDGRLQAPKKRTDRSYLRQAGAPAVAEPPVEEEILEAPADEALPEAAVEAATAADPTTAFAAPAPAPAAEPAPAAPAAPAPRAATASTRLPTSVRAIQQQGVRKRRDVDLNALAVRDTQYAIHELRRIAVLATMVIVTLVILGFVLR